MSSSRTLAVGNRLARLGSLRRALVVDHDLDTRVLTFLAAQPDGSASFGRLSLEFGGPAVAEALDRLEGRRQVDRFDGCEFHVTYAGRSRIGGLSS